MSAAGAPAPDSTLVDAVAQRVIELLGGDEALASHGASGGEHRTSLTVADIAALYGVSRSWVYTHQRELGAMRLGSGPRARLRFNPKVVAAAVAEFAARRYVDDSPTKPRRRRRELRLIPFEPMS